MQLPRMRYRATDRRCPIPARHRRPALERLEGRLCPSGYLLVGSYDTNSVMRYDEGTGAFVDAFVPEKSGGLREPVGLVFGPDHNLYVGSGLEPDQGTGHKAVLRYDGTTGSFLDDFADSNQIQSTRSVLFGPDGNLYVADGFASAILRYDSTTGAFLGDFVPAGSGGLFHPVSMVFGPDGLGDGKLDLYVGCVFTNTILRYDGATGAFKGQYVPAGSGGMETPQGLVFGPDGDLYVASGSFSSTDTGSVLRFDGPSGPNPGAFVGAFIPAGRSPLHTPGSLLFGPDTNHDGHPDLYVTSAVVSVGSDSGKLKLVAAPGTSEVLRYDGTTGAFLGAFVTPDSGGVSLPLFMTFTETDPTTLNYDGSAVPDQTAALTSLTGPVTSTPNAIASGPIDQLRGLASSDLPVVAIPAGTEPWDQGWCDSSSRATGPAPVPTAEYPTLSPALTDLGGRPHRRMLVNDLARDRNTGASRIL